MDFYISGVLLWGKRHLKKLAYRPTKIYTVKGEEYGHMINESSCNLIDLVNIMSDKFDIF